MFSALRRLRDNFRFLISDEKGSYLALIAFMLTGVVGFAGMGIDLAMWYQEKRTTQNIADAAAVAATHVSQRGGDLTEMTAAAMTEAVRNGFLSGPNNQVIVNASASGPVGNAVPVVDVEVRRAVPLFMMAVFRSSEQVISAAASAGTQAQGGVCVIGLDYLPKGANVTSRNVEFVGNTSAVIECGVHSNSKTADSLYIGGNTTLMGTPASADGDIMISGGASVDTTVTMQPNFGYVIDPLEGRDFPSWDDIMSNIACAAGGGLMVNSDVTIGSASPEWTDDAPGIGNYRICGDVTVMPGSTLTLDPGIYYVDGGDILIQGNLEANGVTIVLIGASPSHVGEVDIRAQAVVNLRAPTKDEVNPHPYWGIALMQHRDSSTSGNNIFNGGASLTITGYLYLKNQQVTFNGGSDVDSCTIILARSIKFNGTTDTTYIKNTDAVCQSVDIDVAPVQSQVVLVQ